LKYKDPIAVIGAGCVLPGAPDVSSFWKLLLAGENQFNPLPESRLPSLFFTEPGLTQNDSTYSNLAAFVRDDYFFDPQNPLPRAHQMTLKALKEAVTPLGEGFFKSKKVAVVLGCMNPEDLASKSLMRGKYTELREQIINKTFEITNDRKLLEAEFNKLFQFSAMEPCIHYPTSIADSIHQFLNTRGLSLCADSACASSLTAIQIANLLLESDEADVVITGGVESHLGIETYVLFSRLGVLAQNHCLPYDSRSEGIVQGEGAVIFVLERLKENKNKTFHPWGVLDGITSSSNGSKSSLFSPSFESQKRIFEELNSDLSEAPVDYIEGHGTGTPVGDSAELKALGEAFSRSKTPVYLGSVKSLIGHTKGTAGAAGLLKCFLSIKHRTVPPSKYFQNNVHLQNIEPLFINAKPISLPLRAEPIRMRVCSAGFGGANYHLAISECLSDSKKKRAPQNTPPKEMTYLVAHSQIPFQEGGKSFAKVKWKIPPKDLPNLDVSQLSGLLAVDKAFGRSLITDLPFEKDKIVVITASHTRTEKIESLMKILHLRELTPFVRKHFPKQLDVFEAERKSLIELDETICQCLNSMTSGRISNELDFRGPNFHIDADFASLGYAIKVAEMMLQSQSVELVIVLAVGESLGEHPSLIQRETMSCWAFSSAISAAKYSLPRLGELSKIDFKSR